MSQFSKPFHIGALSLSNRVVMAPLTRMRAFHGRAPGDLQVAHYRQRASAGLILTEATSVMPMGVGYPNTPGIWSAEQVAGWKRVTEAVHAEGGRIALQLWHVGRISDPELLDGQLPVAPSAIAAEGEVNVLRPKRPYAVPRALETAEMRASSRPLCRPRATPKRPALTSSKCMQPTAICLTSFCMMAATSARTSTAAA